MSRPAQTAHPGKGRERAVSRRSFLQGAGLAVLMTSYMYSWTVGDSLGVASFEGIGLFIALGILLICANSIRRISHILACMRRVWFVYFLLAIIVTLSLLAGSSKDFVWAIFGVGILFALHFLSAENEETFVLGFMFLAGVAVVLYVVNVGDAVHNARAYGDSERVSLSADNQAYTLVAYAGGLALISAILVLLSNAQAKWVAFAFTLTAALAIFMAGTRSIYLGVTLGMSYLLVSSPAGNRALIRVAVFAVAFSAIGVVLSVTGFMADRFTVLLDAISRASYTIIGLDIGAIDDAAAGRVYQRQYAWELLADNPIFGKGFKYFWVDFPLLQAFSDLGIFFGICYIVCFFFVPLAIARKMIREVSLARRLLIALYILNCPRLFLHGQPYDWVHYTYLFLPFASLVITRFPLSRESLPSDRFADGIGGKYRSPKRVG